MYSITTKTEMLRRMTRQYQVCAKCGGETWQDVMTVYATSVSDAYERYYLARHRYNAMRAALGIGGQLDGRAHVQIYPVATVDGAGEDVQKLANYLQVKYLRWRIRNNYTQSNLDEWEKQEEQGAAALAVWETLVERPNCTMHDCYRAVMAAIGKHRRYSRKRADTVAYDADFDRRNNSLLGVQSPVNPELEKAVSYAINNAKLTPKQLDAIIWRMAGNSNYEYAKNNGIDKKTAKERFYSGAWKILDAAAADPDAAAAIAAGFRAINPHYVDCRATLPRVIDVAPRPALPRVAIWMRCRWYADNIGLPLPPLELVKC
jgi:hypothetical protein